MNRNILLSDTKIKFERHLSATPQAPFIVHQHIPNPATPLGTHENLELQYYTDGESVVQYDGKHYPVYKGDIVVVNSYAVHRVTSSQPLPLFCLIIDRSFCLQNGFDPVQLLFHPVIHGDGQARSLFQIVIDTYNQTPDPFYNLALRCAVQQLLLYLCRSYSQPRPEDHPANSPSMQHVQQAITYMKSNLHRRITVEDIAANAGLSKYHFLRRFKYITGQTPTHYLNALRCEYARSLLASGEYSIKETACRCGFPDTSYFARVFRQYTGLLPSQVR